MRNLVTLAVILIAASILLNSSCYIVDEREQVVVTEFGQPVRTVQSPGLHFKIPFIQQLHTFEDRLLYSDADPDKFNKDKKNIVDNFARWRIKIHSSSWYLCKMSLMHNRAWTISFFLLFEKNWGNARWSR